MQINSDLDRSRKEKLANPYNGNLVANSQIVNGGEYNYQAKEPKESSFMYKRNSFNEKSQN